MTVSRWKEPESSKKVIVYRKELLRVSETFIKAQVRSYRRWRAVLFGERIWPGGLSLERVTSRTLMDGQPTLIQRVFAKARQTAGCPPASVIRKFEAEGADLMHAHFGHDGILAPLYARNLKVPLVVTLHGHGVNIRPECYVLASLDSGTKGTRTSLPPWCGSRMFISSRSQMFFDRQQSIMVAVGPRGCLA